MHGRLLLSLTDADKNDIKITNPFHMLLLRKAA
jgi:hypothetical protein